MQGKKAYQEKLFTSFQLSEYIPEDNFYRKLSQELDLTFVYKSTAQYYGNEGQKSIDPVVFMKLMLVGYLENINSDRRIIAASRLRLDILYFIGYDIDEELPWHSTLSRTRQLYGEHVFTELFRHVLKQCINKGMVSGRRQAVDGFFVKANASLDSLIEKEVLEDVISYSEELKANQEDDKSKKIDILPLEGIDEHINNKKHKNKVSNDTHYSPSDPEARISVKRGKPVAMNYLGEVAVDTATHMITHIQAFTADKRDSECLPAVLLHTRDNLLQNGITLEEIVADTGFSSGAALRALQAMKITGYIPNTPHFRFERPGFSYHAQGDYYQCHQGLTLTYRGTYLTGNNWTKEYRGAARTCGECAYRESCEAYKMKNTRVVINETLDKPYYDQMHQRMQTRKARRLMKLRQSTVEPVIGTLVTYLGIKQVGSKGLAQANKCLTMAAVAYNLKKMIKKGINLIQQKPQEIMKMQKRILCTFYRLNKPYNFYLIDQSFFQVAY